MQLQTTQVKNSVCADQLATQNLHFLQSRIPADLNLHFFPKQDILKVSLLRVKKNWPRGYKTFSMLNSAEHEISTAHKN